MNHAALAWDGGRSAARALSDSLRLFEEAGRVDVLTVGPRSGWPIDDLLTHLDRHGVEATHHEWPKSQTVAATLVNWCKRNRPSLLVLGAFEHSKFKDLSQRIDRDTIDNGDLKILHERVSRAIKALSAQG